MRCPNCHNDNPNGYRFCLQCGEDLGEPTIVQRPETVTRVRAPSVADDDIPVSREGAWPVIGGAASGVLIALVIVAALIGCYAIFAYFYGDPLGIATALPTTTPTPTPELRVPTPRTTREPSPEPTPIAAASTTSFEQPTYRDETTDASEPTYRVFMPKGAIGVTIAGPRGSQTEVAQTFLLKARAGQTFAATLVALRGGAPTFVITDNGSQLSGEVHGTFAQTLPASGDVAIRVCCASPFRLDVEIR